MEYKNNCRLINLSIAVVLMFSVGFVSDANAQGGGNTSVPNCRFGVTIAGNFSPFDNNEVQNLHAGWYVNWLATPSSGAPTGVEHINVIRLTASLSNNDGYISSPSDADLAIAVANRPGETWIIGNEPDSIWQDDLDATSYANAYHHLYALIKNIDATAQVGIGAVVQPTSLRFSYLNKILSVYQTQFHENIPVDVWNIHSFILREISAQHPDAQRNPNDPLYKEVWGAFIPSDPIFNGVLEGVLYNKRDIDNIGIFQQRLIEFRKWMANHGQRYKPLIISEYGILFPEWISDEDSVLFSQERVANFMTQSFDVLRTATDPSIGYPSDGNHLVQRWAWFSVDGNLSSWGGTLFDPQSGNPRLLAQTYQDYTAAITPTANLKLTQTTAQWFPSAGSDTLSIGAFKLNAQVSNSGNIATNTPITITFFEGDEHNLGNKIAPSEVITTPIAGCGSYVTLAVTWTNVVTGVNPYVVEISSMSEGSTIHQSLSGFALVPITQVYLPIIFK